MRCQVSNQRFWHLDAAALRLLAALLRNDPACRVAVRGLQPPAAAASLAGAGRGSRLSLRGSGGGEDGELQAEQLALLTGDGKRPGSGRFVPHISCCNDAAALCSSTQVLQAGSEWVQ